MTSSPKETTPYFEQQETRFPDVQTTLNLFGIHRRKVDGRWSYPIHEHPQYEINYLLEGKQMMTVNGVDYEQNAGDLLLLRPGDVHSSRSGDGNPFDYFCLHFNLDDRLFISLLGRMEQVLFPENAALTAKVNPVLRRMLELGGGPDLRSVARRMQLQSTAFELFGVLWDAISAETAQLKPQVYDKVELAHEIASRLQGTASLTFQSNAAGGDAERTRIGDIAADLNISVSYLNRVFHEVYGMSPRAYWSGIVLHESKQLLSDFRYSIHAIAETLGYRDIAHFSRQFKRWTGLSPSEYRKKLPQEE